MSVSLFLFLLFIDIVFIQIDFPIDMVLSLLKNKNIKGDQTLVHIGVGDIHLTFQYFTWCTDTTLKKEFPSFVNVHVVFRPGVGAPHTDELQKLPSIDCLFQPCLLSLWFP